MRPEKASLKLHNTFALSVSKVYFRTLNKHGNIIFYAIEEKLFLIGKGFKYVGSVSQLNNFNTTCTVRQFEK